ncbi:MAG: 4-(cytidine 5'-diphospho)-2-C-methyl-D-erythritol kinase [Chloroflexi bacterium]|nr:4-(cytidine 5'-diphospho)-2-C-methyl-D-erythritol kinase [Chloroflexota bacterium]
MIITAPAKINLTLEVLGKRPDGFHEIRSVMQTIGLCDRLSFGPATEVTFKSDLPEWAAEKSLLSNAVSLLQSVTGCRKGVAITIAKRIPLISGLGGDSSDAAATLLGLNQIWGLGLSPDRLSELAAQLGSDVPFFLSGGTALVRGRGELVTPLLPPPPAWVLLMLPPVPRLPGKTAQLYASLKPAHYTDGQITQTLVKALQEGKGLTPNLLFNAFENILFARDNELSVYRSHILKIGASNVHVAGSGPALFSLVKDKAEAEDLCVRLSRQGMTLYVVKTVSASGHSLV